MCGRFTLTAPWEEVLTRFSVDLAPAWLPPRYNVAPAQELPVLVSQAGKRVLRTMAWGLLMPRSQGSTRVINVRSETVVFKPWFRRLLHSQRCLVPADGYYEWHALGKVKQPYRIVLPQRKLFAFAGLYSIQTASDGHIRGVFALLTCAANDRLAGLHPRMPVILPESAEEAWLSPRVRAEQAVELLQPCPSAEVAYYPVSTRVNRPDVDDPECIQPVQGLGLGLT
ncbi:MAG: SOS response-associated peptidase [Alicyclobacillus sp.]|nr:SOS response-associated peptidase [Alicyclobacillus sp.]